MEKQRKNKKIVINQHIKTKEVHFKWIESLKNRNDWKFWIIFVGKIPIGSAYLQNLDFKKLSSEWGFYIGEDEYRGTGAIIEYIILEYFFNILKFENLNGTVLENSTLVIRMHKKFGFKIIGREKNHRKKETYYYIDKH